DNEYDFYVKDETFGAMFESIIKEVFEISHDDNKLVQEYTNKIRKESKKDIIKSMDMLDNLADSPTKLELSMEILNEKNIKIIEEHIESIEREYFATNENI
ncbi:MAG: hypothetical protein Q4A47_06680, partial [Erysipelotrichaceae bacterium]|nr:hypothetical protein [Erysipelotrichaceae bacterium]